MSAEGSTPALASGTSYIAALAVKQSGVTDAPIRFVQRLFASLGFVVNVGAERTAARGRAPELRRASCRAASRRSCATSREVGYNRAVAKRHAAAAMLSVAGAARGGAGGPRTAPIAEAQHLRAVGVGSVNEIKATLSARYGISPALIHHGLYGRGTPRVGKGWSATPDHSGEVAWLPVLANEPTGTTGAVYDVVTGRSRPSASSPAASSCTTAATRPRARTCAPTTSAPT